MIRWFVNNKVAANLLMVGIVLGGLFAIAKQITFEVFPSIRPDMIEITTAYQGASPEQIDRLISVPIQQAIDDIPEVDKITAISYEGSSRVVAELIKNADVDEAKENVEQKVAGLSNLPEGADKPSVVAPTYQTRALQLIISGALPEAQLNALVSHLETQLSQIPDVRSVSNSGLRQREFTITVDQTLLEKYGFTLASLNNTLRTKVSSYSLGDIDTQRGRLLLKSDNEPRTAQDFSQLIIKTLPSGGVLRLQDIAKVVDGFATDKPVVKLNGKKAAFINIYQSETANIIQLSSAVKAMVSQENHLLPEGVEIRVINDASEVFKSRLNTLVTNGIQGGLLVMLVLALLLRLRYAFWVAIGIPVTFLGGFLIMPWFDISLNMLTTFGYILVLGIVVDDAIVTAENVFVHYRRHGDQRRAAIEGTEEIAMPVTFGVLTTIAAMLPFFLVTGAMGTLFGFLASVVIAVLLFSLVESKLILPAHLASIDRSRPSPIIDGLNHIFGGVSVFFERLVIWFYRPALRLCISNIGASMGFFIAMLIIIIGLVIGGKVPFSFFPSIPGDSISVDLNMPTGTPFETTLQTVDKIEAAAVQLREKHQHDAIDGYIREIIVRANSKTPESAYIEFQLAPTEMRLTELSNEALLAEWQSLMGALPGVDKLSYQTQAFVGGGSDVAISLIGKDVQALKSAGDIIKARLAAFDGVIEVANSRADGRLEIDMQLTPVAESQGLQLNDIANQVRSATGGLLVKKLLISGSEVEVMLRFPAEQYDSLSALKTLPITIASGTLPLGAVVTLCESVNTADLFRENGQLLATVSAKVDSDVAVADDIQAAIEEEAATLLQDFSGIEIEKGADKREEQETNQSIFYGMLLAGLLIYILLAIPFKSYGKPIIVLSIVPFGLAGAVLGHYVYGSSLYMPSLLGMLALLGILVNDSLVMVDYINKAYRDDVPLKEAVLTAGVRRFRPIFLTTLTTVVGVLPLLFETSLQAQFLKPMAISMGFGILFGTFVTLFLVPINYMIYEYCRPLYSPAVKMVAAFGFGGFLVLVLWALDFGDYLSSVFDLLPL